LVFKILVCTASEREKMLPACVRKLCEKWNNLKLPQTYEAHFLHTNPERRDLGEILNRMKYWMEISNLVLIDVTPSFFKDDERRYYTIKKC